MAHTTPKVEGSNLYLLNPEQANAVHIQLESEQWYAWLESHYTFRVKSTTVIYTARKERRAGLWYWYAYRRSTGKLRIAYLGKSAELTLARLNSVAQVLALPPTHSGQKRKSARSSATTSQEFPTREASPAVTPLRGNLRAPLTNFIGRQREIAEATQLLMHSRLLTLTGPGGSGKTRLALHIASSLAESFPGGLWLLDLTGISASTELLPTLALALGIQSKTEQELLTAIQIAFQAKPALLIFDNCEHLLDTCAPLAENLLTSIPALHILATSREMLCIPGETILPVPPLSLPEQAESLTPSQGIQSEAVQFLLEQIRLLQPSFSLTAENTPVVIRICQQLEGIPLALELAAARFHLMPLEQISQRLDEKTGARFHLLNAGKRTATARHQTLRATIDWSYQLLSADEQRLLRQLSIFRGGWTLEAAEAICTGENLAQVEILALLGNLVHKSLVQMSEEVFPALPATPLHTHKRARYHFLETIREYSREKLQTTGEEQALLQQHLHVFLQLAQKADTHLRGPQQLYGLACLDGERGNLQAALHTARQTDHTAALQLTSALTFYWMIRSQFLQGRTELEETFAVASDCTTIPKAACLSRASLLTFFQGDIARSRQLAETSLALYRNLDDQQDIGPALCMQIEVARQANATQQALALGEDCTSVLTANSNDWMLAFVAFPIATIHMHQGRGKQALQLLEESLHLMRKQGDRWGQGMVCSNIGKLQGHFGNYAPALAYFEESAALAREIGDNNGIAAAEHALALVCLHDQNYTGAQEQLAKASKLYTQSGNLTGLAEALFDHGYIASLQGDFTPAVQFFEQASALYSNQGNQMRISLIRYHLGRIAVRQHDISRALSLLRESCAIFHQNNQRIFLAGCLEALATVSIQLRSPQQGARWLGQAQALHPLASQQRAIMPAQNAFYETTITTLQTLLTSETFDAEFSKGKALPLEYILREIQELPLPEEISPSTPLIEKLPEHPFPIDLTVREREVLRLLATGMSNYEIANSLSISSGTVRTHLSAIYSKLAAHSRTAAIHTARMHGLL